MATTTGMEAKKLCKKIGIKLGKMVGSGIYMSMQSYKCLQEGDYAWDADFGVIIWNGATWLSQTDIQRMNNGK